MKYAAAISPLLMNAAIQAPDMADLTYGNAMYGAFIGAVLIELIRNGLFMAGVDSNWQGFFIGVVIVFAVLLNRIRGSRGD